jgi:hypothetical protein
MRQRCRRANSRWRRSAHVWWDRHVRSFVGRGGIEDDWVVEAGVEPELVAADTAVDQVEEAEHGAGNRSIGRWLSKPRPGMDTGEGPPRHHRGVVADNPCDGDVESVDVATKALHVGDQPGSPWWPVECLVGLVDYVAMG